jgi:SAM-dependent methyltransferase
VNPTSGPRAVSRLVAAGYDRIGYGYAALGERNGWGAGTGYLDLLLRTLRPGSRVLDLGCGPGVPVTAALAAAHRVVAVDISGVQLGLARRHAPGALLVQADLTDVEFGEETFDAVVCFYSMTHLPRALHPDLLRRMRRWLRPGGLAVLTMGAGDHPDIVAEDFLGLGAPLFVSHFDADTNRALVAGAGLRVLRADLREQVEDGRTVRFCWVVAERPA